VKITELTPDREYQFQKNEESSSRSTLFSRFPLPVPSEK